MIVYWEEQTNRTTQVLKFLSILLSTFSAFELIIILLGGAIGASTGIHFLGLSIVISLSLILLFFLRHHSQSFIIRSTLQYALDAEGITFKYWLGNNKTVTFPYDAISSYHPVKERGEIISNTIYFNLIPTIDISAYQSFTDDELHMICFEDIKNIEKAEEILKEQLSYVVPQNIEKVNYQKKDVDTSKFSLILIGIAIVYLLASSYILISLIDSVFLSPIELTEIVKKVEPYYHPGSDISSGLTFTTENGIIFNDYLRNDDVGKNVILEVSPLFKTVKSARLHESNHILDNREEEYSLGRFGYWVLSLLFLFCSYYIFKKNGVMPLQDTLFFVVFPWVILLIVSYI